VSRRRERPAHTLRAPVPPPAPEPAVVALPIAREDGPPLLLLTVALLLAGLGGGMLFDNVVPQPHFGPLNYLAGPVSGILAAFALLALTWRPGPAAWPRGAAALFLGFGTWALLSVTRSEDLHSSLTTLVILGSALAAGGAAARLSRRTENALVLAGALTLAGTVAAAAGVQEFLAAYRAGNIGWRVFAGFVNPDFLAGYLLVTIPVALALLASPLRAAGRLLAAFALLLQVVCLLLTQSRLGLVALLLELAAFGVLALRSRALAQAARRVLAIAGVVVVAASIPVAGPMVRRMAGIGTDSHSARFRLLTWRGAVNMANANPVLGTGVGTFEAAYPRHAVVGYTQHTHNSFVQVAAETGWVGLSLLAAAFGAALWSILRAPRGADEEDAPSRSLLRIGVAALLTGSLAHNLFDSDLYIPAIAVTLGLAVGLGLGLASPQGEEEPRPAARPLPVWLPRAAAALMAASLAFFGGRVALGRMIAHGGSESFSLARAAASNPSAGLDPVALALQAVSGYESAVSMDGLNEDYRLQLATLYQWTSQPDRAEAAFRDAVRINPSGKAYYRYGRLLSSLRKAEEAYRMHSLSRRREPNNLQNLLALARSAEATGRKDEAEAVYRRMIEMEAGAFGQVRALPEVVDWEYGIAFTSLAELLLARGDRPGAEPALRRAVEHLGAFWGARNLEAAQMRVRPEVRRETSDRYAWAMEQWAGVLESLGRSEQARAARERLKTFKAERAEFESRPPAPGMPGAGT
jgi:putative inorganic carbon (HCO3(-)) transporter